MNSQPYPIERFLVAAIGNFLRILLTPVYYVMRIDMGVQYSALIAAAISAGFFAGPCLLLAMTSKINREVATLIGVLVVVGYVRNVLQARRRRRRRDWSVHRWSTGTSLLEPVFLFLGRRAFRKWGQRPWVARLISVLLNDDFIYYVAEPSVLVLVAFALFSIGSTLCGYPLELAIALIVVRNAVQSFVYLKAHEVVDGKKDERAIKLQIEGPDPARFAAGGALARIPPAPGDRAATDDQSVFNRLSPELQMLLMRDRAMQASEVPPAQ
jgi:hypothetical protein